ncbi:MAG: hypothetical protein OEN20_05890, partial [Gammaproteobacteria bacterium]|nr:hypothetical protein [Gammaproteobacteria bacterium]
MFHGDVSVSPLCVWLEDWEEMLHAADRNMGSYSMRWLHTVLMAVVALTCVAGCGGSGGSDTNGELRSETFAWSGQVASGDRIEIAGIAGDVTFTLGMGDEVEVEAVKSGRRDDPSSVTIEALEHAAGVRICTLYPDVPGQAPNTCTPGGTLSSRNNDVEVDFTVRAPPGRTLEAGVIGGHLTAVGVQNDVELRSLGGNIVISTTEIAAASTIGGNVTVTIGSTDP